MTQLSPGYTTYVWPLQEGGATTGAGYKGGWGTLAALQAADPSPAPGDYGYVNGSHYEWNPITLAWETTSTEKRDHFTVTSNGQTTFFLLQLPALPATVALIVNGTAYELAAPFQAFTLSGQSITWVGPFPLVTTDSLVASYT